MVALLISSASLLAAPTVILEPPAPDAKTIRVVLTVAAPTWVDDCVPVELERADGGAWTPLHGPACARPGAAPRIETERVFELPLPESGSWRAVIAFGEGCVDGRRFALAACKTLDLVRSEPVTIP